MYQFFLGDELLPVTPGELILTINNKNETLELVNGGEVSVLKDAGLTDVSFSCLLPHAEFSATQYPDGFQPPDYYLSILEKLKTEKKPFQFIVYRGEDRFHTNLTVSLEGYSIAERAENSSDVTVDVSLKQYRETGTQVAEIIEPEKPQTSVQVKKPEPKREEQNAPAPTVQPMSYTVVDGDCLWTIAKAYYGDGSKWTVLHEANKDKIVNPNLIYTGQVLTIPPIE